VTDQPTIPGPDPYQEPQPVSPDPYRPPQFEAILRRIKGDYRRRLVEAGVKPADTA